jgi:hypothetical protein
MALSLNQGKIVTDGLVLYYDESNDKKSFIGAPTTNLITNGHFGGGLNAEPQGGHNPLNEIVKFPSPGNSDWVMRQTAVGGNAFTEYEMAFTGMLPNTTYCMSCWYYFSPDWNGNQTLYHSRFFSSSGNHNSIGGGLGTTIETRIVDGNLWRRSFQLLNTPADATGIGNWFIGYPSQNTTGFRYFTNIQTEIGTYPTKWSNGVRSNTQAIRDIIANSTLTANNIVYNNNGTLNFNGTNSNIVVNPFVNRPTNSITCAAWINPNRIPSTGTIRGAAISSTSTSYLGIFNSVDGGTTHSLHWAVQTSSSRPTSQVGSLPRNAWSYIVGVYDGTRSRAYINGVEVYNVALTGTLTDGTYYIGAYGPNPTDGTHNFDGRVANAAIYNRGLTAAEISQNFNAQRRIYGI